jgi:3-phosphoshikimate 1-carboxyvinyltransferase
MDRVRIPLQQMGAEISGAGEKNTPPILVSGGHLRGIEYALPVASAQVKSAILLAGLQAEGTTRVVEPSAARDHTERMLRGFGVEVSQNSLVIEVHKSELRGTEVRVPGDVSSAAFFWCAAALRPSWSVTVQGVGLNPTRVGVLDVLQVMGAKIEIANQSESGGEPRGDVTVTGAKLKSTRIAGDLIPRLIDEIPVLALLATQCEGETIIADARELRVK